MIEELTIDDPQNIETRNAASILGSLSLSIIEISRDGHNGIFDGHSQILFSSFLHFSQDLKVVKRELCQSTIKISHAVDCAICEGQNKWKVLVLLWPKLGGSTFTVIVHIF